MSGHLTRWGKKLDRIFEQVEREFEEMGAAFEREFADLDTTIKNVVPANADFQIEKSAMKTTIRVSVPGCGPDQVQVTLANGIVTVKFASLLKGDQEYQFRVGPKVDSSDITATVKNGLLTLVVKRDQQPAPPSGSVKVTG